MLVTLAELLLLALLGGCSSFQDSSFLGLYPVNKTDQFWSEVRPVSSLPSAHYKLGKYYQQRGKHELAVKEFIKAIRLNNGYIEAYNRLAMSYDALNECDKAKKAYMLAISVNPDLAFLHNNYGCSRILCDDFAGAVSALTTALELDGKNRRIKNNLGLAKARLIYTSPEPELLSKSVAPQQKQLPPYDTSRLFVWRQEFTLASTTSQQTKSLLLKNQLSPSYKANMVMNENDPETAEKLAAQLHPFVSSKNNQILSPPVMAEDKQKPLQQQRRIAQDIASIHGVEISNGNGVRGMAKRSAKFFRSMGFSVDRVTNAQSFSYNESIIYYREGCLELAKSIAEVVPGVQDFVKVETLGRAKIGVRLILGADLGDMSFPEGLASSRPKSTGDNSSVQS